MNILSVQGLSKTQGIKPLFSDVSFGVEDGERVGLIGANGSGKSTLLKIIGGAETPDSGTVTFRQGVRVEYLPQDPPYDPSHTVLEHIFHSHTAVADAVAAYELACQAVEADPSDPAAIRRLDEATRRMDAQDAWEYESRAKAILSKLGVTDFAARMGELSGGYRRRVALARALLAEWDLLILDEPTNHLDADTVAWLEDYLRRTPGAVLVVTHDRYFLDRVTQRILEIEGGMLRAFDGNFSYYLERRTEIEQAAARADERRRILLNRELEWLRRGARARRTKEKHRVERVQQMLAERPAAKQNDIQFTTGTRRLGSKIVKLENVSKSLGGRLLIDRFTYTFTRRQRLGIIGPNGAGKTTLVSLMTGTLAPDSGRVDIGSTVSFGYFSQEGPALRPGERAIDFVKREGGEMLSTASGDSLTASQLLERFNFTGQMQYSDAGRLSGGERRRLQLVCTLLRDPNFLILDEPTNDLDIPTLQALEDFLEDYAGCLVLVSHDRYFLDRTVDSLVALEGKGQVLEYPAPYETYTRLRDERAQQQATAPARGGSGAGPATGGRAASPSVAASGADAPAKPKKLSYNEQRELASLEEEIPRLEARREALQAEMAAASTDYLQLQALTREQEEIDARLETAMERWAELAERAG